MALLFRQVANIMRQTTLDKANIGKRIWFSVNVFSRSIHATSTTAVEAKDMEFKFTDNKSGFTTHLPGWAFEDINIVCKDLRQRPYLRCWKVLTKLDFLHELASREGLMDTLQFEDEYYIYMKCVNLERVIPYEMLLDYVGRPYAYGLIFDSHIGRIGNTSFQVDRSVCAAETNQELFRSSSICVCVNFDGQITPLPQWFVEKYREASKLSNFNPLRISLGKNIMANDYVVLHKSRYQVRFSEADRYNHTNNTSLLQYTGDAISSAFNEMRLPNEIRTPGMLENSVKTIDVDFVSGSIQGATLVASVVQKADTPNNIFCLLHNNGKLVLVQSMEYDFAETAHATL